MQMKHIIILAALLLTSCSVQRYAETAAHRDTAHVVFSDSVRYEIVTSIRDTSHVIRTETEKLRTIRYVDPETGQLRRRIAESEQKLQSILDQMLMLQVRIDSIESHRNDSLPTETDKAAEKYTEAESPWTVIITMVCVVIFLGFIMSNWKRIVR
jgi:hypothetical protein